MDLASAHGIVVVLKGHRTLVTDGQRTARNETGNPGMATGGAGDVLTGVLTALLGQGLPAWEAARLGVFAHGLAGDLAARQQTQLGMTARDLVQFLPEAWRALGY
jgi:NAD(P)H-hydrate epimerase